MKLEKNPLISYARLYRADKKMQGSTETKRLATEKTSLVIICYCYGFSCAVDRICVAHSDFYV